MKQVFSLLFCLGIFISQAQQITILNQTSKEPIVGVAVYNKQKTKSVVSNLEGQVTLDKFENDEILFFQHISFITISYVKFRIPSTVYLKANEQNLDEIVISASKFEQSKKEVPQKILSYKADDIVFSMPQTSADLLQNTGQVFVQKSQLGGGSPMIRGFSTNRLLLSVDDVRMNNAIFRGGNIQNVISIDPFSVERTEVILGSGSVIYGSDAIGGVMNFYTQKPELSSTEDLNLKGNVIARYASASEEKTGHVDLNFGLKKWAFVTNISYTDFSDLKMGKHGPDDYLRPEYVVTENGEDIIVQNDDPRVQRYTGYDQINVMQKVHYKANDRMSYDLGLHYSSTSEYPRYDRLILYENDQLRSAEWNYGPQDWFLGKFQFTKLSSRSNLYDKIKFNTAYQNFKESRIDRNLNAVERRIREENVDAISANLDFEKSLSDRTKLFYGVEYIFNRVGSKGKQENINTGTTEKIASRYPDGSTWQSSAAYLSLKYKPSRQFAFQSGIRYNFISIRADLTENNEFFNFPFDNADLDTGALTGTAGISWLPNEIMNWKLNLTTAFRAPNIDDVGKIFDSAPGMVVVPNPDLKPEYAYGAELGLRLNFNTVKLDFATYYTFLDDALVRRNFTINGQSHIIYDGELSQVQAIQNAAEAKIYGFEVGANIKLTNNLKITSQYSIVGGNTEEEDGTEVPVRHVAPYFGNTHLIWENRKLKLDAFAIYNNELSFNQMAPSEIDKDYLYARDENGNPYSPSWYTLNVRSQYSFTESLSLTATIENITNQRYRPYSSGLAASGTNVIIAVKYSL